MHRAPVLVVGAAVVLARRAGTRGRRRGTETSSGTDGARPGFGRSDCGRRRHRLRSGQPAVRQRAGQRPRMPAARDLGSARRRGLRSRARTRRRPIRGRCPRRVRDLLRRFVGPSEDEHETGSRQSRVRARPVPPATSSTSARQRATPRRATTASRSVTGTSSHSTPTARKWVDAMPDPRRSAGFEPISPPIRLAARSRTGTTRATRRGCTAATRRTRRSGRRSYDASADLVLVGHDHDYERFAPQNARGGRDLARGMREFVVGTGGRSLQEVHAREPEQRGARRDEPRCPGAHARG